MMQWIMNNISTIFVSLILLGVVIMVVKNLRKKDGSSSCGGSCGGCASSSMCHGHTTFVDDYHKNQIRN